MKWQPLTKLEPRHGEFPDYEVQFPDGVRHRPCSWKDIVEKVVVWLEVEGYLGPEDCPIQRANAPKRYLVNTEPVHFDGSQFSDPDKVGALYLEMKDNNDKLVENASIIIDSVAPELMSDFTFRRVR